MHKETVSKTDAKKSNLFPEPCIEYAKAASCVRVKIYIEFDKIYTRTYLFLHLKEFIRLVVYAKTLGHFLPTRLCSIYFFNISQIKHVPVVEKRK